MGTGWKYNTKAKSRPKKSITDRKRRVKTQSKRLVKLGVSAGVIRKMNAKEIRTALKRPAKLTKALAKTAAKGTAKAK